MSKRPEKTTQTRRELRQAFWQLCDRMPFEKVTVAQICERAGYNRGTFYLHYEGLQEMVDALEQELLDGMEACVEKALKAVCTKKSKLAQLTALKDVMAYFNKYETEVKILLGKQADPNFITALKARLKPLWRTYVITNTGSHTDAEIDLMLEHTLSGMLTMVGRWLIEPDGVGASEIGKLVYDTSIRDVSARAAQ